MLEVNGIDVFYGMVHALKKVSLKVVPNEITALLGANGSGKTTTLNTISGLIQPKNGSIQLDGKRIDRLEASKIVRKGLIQCPENRQLFRNLSVRENILSGAIAVKDRRKIKEKIEKVWAYFPILKERKTQVAGTLSGGEQQMCAIARALMSDINILMLDEPSLGLAPKIVDQIFDLLTQLNQIEHMTLLIVEQNAFAALQISHKAYILENGRVALQGISSELLKSDSVKEKYLGI